MTDRSQTGEPGRKGDPGRVGDTGRTGDQGDTGRGPRGYPGAQGTPGVTSTLTVTQLDDYVRRLEGRYRRVSRRLTAALVVVSVALLGTLAWTADGLTDRADEQEAQRRDAITKICEAKNEQNAKFVRFQEITTPESAKLARATFTEADCRAEARRLTGGPQ